MVGRVIDPSAVTSDSTDIPQATTPPNDLAAIERDLAGVEAALARLIDGSYWFDEATGEPIPDDVLVDDPVTRRVRS